MNRKLWLSRILPFVLLGTLLEHWDLVRFAVTAWRHTMLGFGVSLAWLMLILASIVGIRARRRWGALSLIALMPVSTVMLGVSLVPLVTSVFPVGVRPYVLMLLNVLVLVAAVVLATPPVRQPVHQPVPEPA